MLMINTVGASERKAILEAYLKSQAEQAEQAKQDLITEGAVKEALAWSEDDEDNMDKIISAIKNTAGFKRNGVKLMVDSAQLSTHSLLCTAEDGTLYRFAINKVVKGTTVRV